MNKRLFIIFGLLFGILANVKGSNLLFPNNTSTTWNNFCNMKLPFDANVVYTIFQDSNGLIWIGTKRGLVNYNGYNYHLCYYGKNMPDEVVDSTGARFLQQQLIASDLDGGLECTKEYEDSIVMAKNTDAGVRYQNSLSDGTSFMWNVQCERGNAGYTFDGIDSSGQNIPIQIKGNPKFTGLQDTYYNVDAAGTIHPPPPQIWLCRDTYWLASVDGLKYVPFDTPQDKQVYQ